MYPRLGLFCVPYMVGPSRRRDGKQWKCEGKQSNYRRDPDSHHITDGIYSHSHYMADSWYLGMSLHASLHLSLHISCDCFTMACFCLWAAEFPVILKQLHDICLCQHSALSRLTEILQSREKRLLHVVARYFFLNLLSFSVWPCLAVA